jgi:polysaccharide export outer membrane protein
MTLPLSMPAQTTPTTPLPAANGSTTITPSAPGVLPPPGESHPQSDSYVLRSNDFIRITVFQEDDLLTETRISESGYINFPLLGPVMLSGKTVGQAISEIRMRLDKDYIINPQVTLMVLEFAQQWITVLGEVQRPGLVAIPPEGGIDLLGAIALAGGYTRIADPSHIIVRRIVNGQDQVLKVNAQRLARDVHAQQFLVRPGDRISVAESLW